MNRFKFRAWHTKAAKKQMIDLRKITPLSGATVPGVFLPDDPDVIIMQSTGLEDKTGREIFESDILDIVGARFVILWHFNRWALSPLGKHKNGKGIREIRKIDVSYFYASIGNIYENPELLEAK